MALTEFHEEFLNALAASVGVPRRLLVGADGAMHIPERASTYLVTKNSSRDLKWCGTNWELAGLRFPSLRTARVFIKRNKGLLNITFAAMLPGSIHPIDLDFEIKR